MLDRFVLSLKHDQTFRKDDTPAHNRQAKCGRLNECLYPDAVTDVCSLTHAVTFSLECMMKCFPGGRCGCHGRHIQIPGPIRSFCALTLESFAKTENFSSEAKTLNRENSHLFVRKWVEQSFKPLIDRTIRECRSEERRVAERHSRKQRLEARNSCIPDARNYRVARRLPLLDKVQF